MEEKPLEILVVEDKPENIKAAQEYFKSQHVEVDYVKSSSEAEKALKTKDYDLALIDWELPEGKKGFDILDEAESKAIPSAVFSEGEFYHGGLVRRSELFFDRSEMEEKKPSSYELGPKDQTKTWADAYKKLQEISGKEEIKEIREAKARYKKFTGKIFKRKQ